MKTILATLTVLCALTIASSDCYGQDQKNDTTHVVKKDKMKLLTMPSPTSAEAAANSKEQKGATPQSQQPAQPPAGTKQESTADKKKN